VTLTPALAGSGNRAPVPAVRPAVIAAVAVCGLCEAGALIVYWLHFTRWPWQDWLVYYGAARLYYRSQLAILLSPPSFTAYLNTAFAAWLPQPFGFRSWVYPPPFLLLLLPFGLLPFVASCLLFQGITLAGLLAALRQFAPGRRGLLAAAVIFSPPAAFNFGTGQNGFLTTALLVGGFAFTDRHPVLAGVFLGLLTYKPQFWPLAALALIAARQWRALAAALAAAVLMCLAGLLLFGSEAWRVFLQWAAYPPAAEYQSFLHCCLLHDESVATNLTLLGAGALAAIGQACAVLLAAAAVWVGFRRRGAREPQLALLLAAAALAAPHVSNYDAVLLALSAGLLFAYGLDHGFRRGGLIVPVLAWVIQAFNPPDVFSLGALTPVLTLLLIGVALARCSDPTRSDNSGAIRAGAANG
jgi:alpha-1,2-mannosyltransferase